MVIMVIMVIMVTMVIMVIMVIRVVRITPVKSFIGIITHQDHISQVSASKRLSSLLERLVTLKRGMDKCQMMVNEGTIMNATNSFDHVDPDRCFLIINHV